MGKKKKQIAWFIDCNGCHNCTSHYKNKQGYIRVHIGKKLYLLHRVVYSEKYLNGCDIPDGLIVRHKCDNPSCINPLHLELGTKKDNSDDKMKRGRFKNGCEKHNGEAHSNSTLKESDIIDIISSTESRRALSIKYGVHKEHIGKIQRRKAWVRISATIQ